MKNEKHLKPKAGFSYVCTKKAGDAFVYEVGQIVKCFEDNYLGKYIKDYWGNDSSRFDLYFDIAETQADVKDAVQKTGETMAAKAKEYLSTDSTKWKEAAKEAGDKLEQSKHKGLRFNTGKKRFDLVHPWAHEQMVNVLTKGAQKYAERNWEKGMAWSNVIASLERHFVAIKSGEDYDPETGELHAAHLACNAHFLTAYYKIYPQGDDRPHTYLNRPKIGLDIDEVLADFVGAWTERHGMTTPECWNFDTHFNEKMEEVKNDKDFWMSIKPRISPKDLPFEPHCYITSRSIPKEWTEQWIADNGFPTMPVYCVDFNHSKVEVAKESGIDLFVDDRYENFVELNNAGICTFLMDSAHNQRYEVGFKRIFNLKDLV